MSSIKWVVRKPNYNKDIKIHELNTVENYAFVRVIHSYCAYTKHEIQKERYLFFTSPMIYLGEKNIPAMHVIRLIQRNTKKRALGAQQVVVTNKHFWVRIL